MFYLLCNLMKDSRVFFLVITTSTFLLVLSSCTDLDRHDTVDEIDNEIFPLVTGCSNIWDCNFDWDPFDPDDSSWDGDFSFGSGQCSQEKQYLKPCSMYYSHLKKKKIDYVYPDYSDPASNYIRHITSPYFHFSDDKVRAWTLNFRGFPKFDYDRVWSFRNQGEEAISEYNEAIYNGASSLLSFSNRTQWIARESEDEPTPWEPDDKTIASYSQPWLWTRGLTTATCLQHPSPDPEVDRQKMEFYVPESGGPGLTARDIEKVEAIQFQSGNLEKGKEVRIRFEATISEIRRSGPAGRPSSFFVEILGAGYLERGRHELLDSERYELSDFYFGKRTLVSEAIFTTDSARDTAVLASFSINAYDQGVHFTLTDVVLTIEYCKDSIVLPPTPKEKKVILSSPVVCEEFANSCPPEVLTEFLYTPESRIPRRTVLGFRVNPNAYCPTKKPLNEESFKVRLDDESWQDWYFLRDQQFLLQRRDRRAAETFEIKYLPPALREQYEMGCVSLVFEELNAPDIESPREAQDIIDFISNDLVEARSARDSWQSVLNFSAAYDLLHFLTEYWFLQVTHSGEELQLLVEDVLDVYQILYGLAQSGELENTLEVSLTADELLALLDLKEFLETNSIGAGPTSYGEILGGGDANLLVLIESILYEFDRRNIATEYVAWEDIVQRFGDELAEAETLLDRWLMD